MAWALVAQPNENVSSKPLIDGVAPAVEAA